MEPPRRPRVVVTDRDPAFLALPRGLLAEEVNAVAVPPDLRDPSPFVRAQRPDAVVLDLVYRREAPVLMVLDRLDSVLDRLRLDPATAVTPVLVCTTTPGTLEGLQGREAEALSVLAKPFDLERLLARLAAMLAAQPSPPRGGEEGPGVRLPRRRRRVTGPAGAGGRVRRRATVPETSSWAGGTGIELRRRRGAALP